MSWLRALGLAFVASVLAGLSGCSPPEPTTTVCSASTCKGCCKANRCITTVDETNCGASGSACQECRANETCSDGDCVVRECNGCVDPVTLACVPGTTNDQCGNLGGVCAKCGTGTACKEGVCASTACLGCLDGAGGACVAGNTDQKCGAGGAACQACTGGQACVDKACKSPPACGPTNCASGCCDSTDTCQMTANTDAACGSGGGPCEVCSSPATCTDGKCVAACGPGNAAGCCDADGKEQVSNTEHCGSGGAACKACAAGEICSSGECISTTCSGTCLGCCTGTGGATCDPGTGVNGGKCGKNGAACSLCGTNRTCSNGVCIVDPDSLWDVVLVSGVVPLLNESGGQWDSIAAFADPYVVMTLDFGGMMVTAAESPIIDDTRTPNWNNHKMFTGKKASLIQKTTYVDVRDDDAVGYDEMGLCSVQLSQSMFNGVPVVFTCGLPAGQTPTQDRPFKWQLTIKLQLAQ